MLRPGEQGLEPRRLRSEHKLVYTASTSRKEQVMKRLIPVSLASLMLGFLPATIQAEVTRVEISSRQDVLGGKAFGSVGPYEKLTGKVFFAVDPKNPHNKIIADLDQAPMNPQGRVEFSADLFILRPKDSSKGNGVIVLDIPNRGGK